MAPSGAAVQRGFELSRPAVPFTLGGGGAVGAFTTRTAVRSSPFALRPLWSNRSGDCRTIVSSSPVRHPATYVPAVGASVIVEHTRGTSTSRRLAAVGRLRLNCRHVRNVGVARGNKRSESGEMMRGMDGSLDYWRRRAVFLATIVKTLRSTISPQWCGWGLVMSLYIWPLGYGEGQSLQLLHTNAKRISKDLKKGFVVGAAQVGARWCGCDDDDSA